MYMKTQQDLSEMNRLQAKLDGVKAGDAFLIDKQERRRVECRVRELRNSLTRAAEVSLRTPRPPKTVSKADSRAGYAVACLFIGAMMALALMPVIRW